MDAIWANLDAIGGGLLTTVELTVLSFACALVLGTVVAVARICPVPLLRALGTGYVEIFRNVPLLMLLVLIVFALPDAGVSVSLFASVVAGVASYAAAYVCEAIRSGVNNVGVGQVEAARAVGMTFTQVLVHVVLPQAFRSMVQPLTNIFIAVALSTSLAASVGVMDLTGVTRMLNVNYAQPVPAFLCAGLCYVLITLGAGLLGGVVERRLRVGR
ncbi:amino acid ABC transporter permease [Pseudonocardia acaciae]|uniref:amino acid ABC transporter permease n=1 Tax=Pseudonocardia acaciae TaxID=551276 RepID=UPI00048AB2FF|nr:amino acid ABC transporter permease [Pseudonocardia acaciae]